MILGTGKVLVMDDEETIRELAKLMLHRIGYDVEVTRDGAEAVACYQQAFESGEPFKAVILDLTVPGGMGGRETLQRLLAIDPHVKAIVCSGYSHDPVMSAFQEYGFSYMLAKPYTLGDLSRALDVVIAARQRHISENA
jgi:two-component system, cell cycle sensor histidine kinase and response regulator CckA